MKRDACTRTWMCMATRTISIDREAYERLRSARTRVDESFSQVIKQAEWQPVASTAAALLAALEAAPVLSARTLSRLEKAQQTLG